MSEVQSQLQAYKNSAQRWQSLFVPDQFASIQVTAAGNSEIWLSSLGNFLLMGFSISVCGTLAAAEELIIEIVDITIPFTIAQYSTFLPATATGGGPAVYFGQDFGGGYGYQSASGSEELDVNLNLSLTSGHVCVNAWGSFGVTPDP